MRLDQALVERALAPSRSKAQALIRGGMVTVAGGQALKPSLIVDADTPIQVAKDAPGWVSRAALKLEHGLDYFGCNPSGSVALDLGASTGGFTQVLLTHGASKVYAVDVGHGQMHPSLRDDPRVVNIEGTNARNLGADDLPPLDLIVSDVSFISLTKALPVPLGFAKPGAWLIALIKPQFEVGRTHIGKGGIVRNPEARDTACDTIRSFLEKSGWRPLGITKSPITGGDGNVEFLIGAIRQPA